MARNARNRTQKHRNTRSKNAGAKRRSRRTRRAAGTPKFSPIKLVTLPVKLVEKTVKTLAKPLTSRTRRVAKKSAHRKNCYVCQRQKRECKTMNRL